MKLQTAGEAIRLARMRRGLTQQQLVDLMNATLSGSEIIERSMISRWEKDLHFPRSTRRSVLEQLLGITIGSPPPRSSTYSAYMKNLSEIQEIILNGLHHCGELWLTTSHNSAGVWAGMAPVTRQFEKLRRNDNCLVKEIFYIRSEDDLFRIKQLSEQNYTGYRLRVRLSPGHPLPVLLAPNTNFGVLLSGFGDDIPNVGLELNGATAGFVEHYFRHLWDYSIPIIANGTINSSNFDKISAGLKTRPQLSETEFAQKQH